VGGANSAGQGALFFARYARTVTILVRTTSLSPRMSRYLVERIRATGNITVIHGVEVAAVRGKGGLSQVVLREVQGGGERTIEAAAMFIFIGTAPRSAMFASLLEHDDKGFILTGPDLPRVEGRPRHWPLEREPFMFETSVPGVFAAGDVRAGANRRLASAVGEGSAAILSVQRYLRTV
jgi:thioredoxin reductase (NADPH)